MTLPELAGVILMALGLAVVILGFVGLLLAVWVMLAGTQEAHWPDEDPTLDVQNHVDDSRPLLVITEEQAEAFVDAHFDRNPDGSMTLVSPDERFVLARIRHRISLMANGYFG